MEIVRTRISSNQTPSKRVFQRTIRSRSQVALDVLKNPVAIRREINNRSLYEMVKWAWPEVNADTTFIDSKHIKFLCEELEKVAYNVANKVPKPYDLIINVPPGTSKTRVGSIIFPVWCWTKWYWFNFITFSYQADVSLEAADYSRDLMKSERFRRIYPELEIRMDKDVKSNYRVIKKVWEHGPHKSPRVINGGSRISTSVGGMATSFHAHIQIGDDPINPKKAISEAGLKDATHFCEQTMSTRKVDKKVTPLILIMQRLAQNDPSGAMLSKPKKKIRHVCLPGEIKNYREYLSPPEAINLYTGDLLDPNRMDWGVLRDMEIDLGQYGYAGQVGQNPTPPGGAMFQVDHFCFIERPLNPSNYIRTVRYWDKAGTAGGGAYTTGVKISQLTNDRWLVEDVRRGQWATHERENIIKETANADGRDVIIIIEQEPGSGGKESAENTVRNLKGFVCLTDRPTGDKVYRADPFSVQVNHGNVILMKGDWNHAFIEEYRFFPHGTYKDQVDAGSGGFNHLAGKREARRIA